MAEDSNDSGVSLSGAPASGRSLKIHYIKSPQCIDVPVHGAYGGINPITGAGHMGVFTERSVIPQETVLIPGGAGVVEKTISAREGVIRTVNAVLFFDINTAIALHDWLGQRIKGFKDAHPELFKDSKK